MICKHILKITFLKNPEFFFLYTVKWFLVFLTEIILFNINDLFAHSEVVTSIVI